MKRVLTYFTMLAVLGTGLFGFTLINDNFINTLRAKLDAYNQAYAEERVYLHIDKPIYKPGDIVWFKGYIVDGTSMKPTPVSTVLHVELIDPRGTTVGKSELYIEGGVARGDFALDKNLAGGLYTIRAFTRWMENFPEEAFFTRQVVVQKVITPRLLLKLDFEKKAYGRSDVVVAKLKARSLKDEPLMNAAIKAQLRLSGVEARTATLTTDNKGEVNIAFQLPDSLSTTDGLVQVIVSAAGLEESISRSVPIVLNVIHMQFFPEGGDMIAGADGRVAFKATNEFGKGADVEGVVIDDRGQVQVPFSSFHFGMGSFQLNPLPGERYSVKITKPAGIAKLFPLPAALPHGMALSMSEKSDSLATARIFAHLKTEAFLVGHVHGIVYYADKVILEEGWNDVDVSISGMPSGIAVFTLFNSEGQEQCERLLFVNGDHVLNIEMKTDRKEYAPGSNVELKIRTTDTAGNPVPANLSIAVVDDQLLTVADDKQDNILSWMLLGSELKGKVEEPSFYFDPSEPKAKNAMDLVLMVHGWRRFTWKEVLTPTRALSYLPENDRDLSGFVVNSRDKKVTVILLELGNRKRIASVKTSSNGHFLFRNIDPPTPMVLVTRKPGALEVNGGRSVSYKESRPSMLNYADTRFQQVPEVIGQLPAPPVSPVAANTNAGLDVSMSSDVTQLSEVIVVGYGMYENKSALGQSVSTIQTTQSPLHAGSIESALAGRIAGVTITHSPLPGANTNMSIRGTASLSNRSEPLWVIDGIPVGSSINSNFTPATHISAGNVESIHVIGGPEATTLFGSEAANGAVLVETKSRLSRTSFTYERRESRYVVASVRPRPFSMVREFYSDPALVDDGTRNNFNSTVSWKHSVITDRRGEATIGFRTNDNVSNFRITAEGMSGTGLVGRMEASYHSLLPFSLDTRLPQYIGFEDTLRIPVSITNNTTAALKGRLNVHLPRELRFLQKPVESVEVFANQTRVITIPVVPTGVAGTFSVTVSLEGNRYSDEVSQAIDVHPVGFDVRLSYSGKELSKSLDIPISNLEKGSLKGELVFVTDVLQDLFSSTESMLREPHGCFEQVSSTTFPNVLVLQVMKQTKAGTAAAEAKALEFIKTGYNLLKGYEIRTGGFEWFGNPPAHEALTAFGLLEFIEMRKVFPGVDEKMIGRTKEWLLRRRAGDGTFRQNRGKYGFSAAPSQVNDAFIVYALSEAGVQGLVAEYNLSLQVARKSKDMYLSALMANSALNYNKVDDFNELKERFSASVKAVGFERLKAESSITCSYGNSLANETVAFWALALMKSPSPDYPLIKDCVTFLASKRSFGGFGSTQATYLSLKAMIEYHKMTLAARADGNIVVAIGDHEETKTFTSQSTENVRFMDFMSFLKEGENTLSFNFEGTSNPLPYHLDLSWNSKTPPSSSDCRLKIETKLTDTRVKRNETVRFTVRLTNVADSGVPMSMALVGIPAGLSLQSWQLKELKEKEVFDFYEIIDDKLAIYYRELGPRERKEINLDLKADIPGSFLSTASCAYLYYTNEFKHWVDGSKIEITD